MPSNPIIILLHLQVFKKCFSELCGNMKGSSTNHPWDGKSETLAAATCLMALTQADLRAIKRGWHILAFLSPFRPVLPSHWAPPAP